MSEQGLPDFHWTSGVDDVAQETNHCAPADDEHGDCRDTGERRVSQPSGREIQIWKCPCGGRTLAPFTYLIEQREQQDREREALARLN